MTDLLGDAAPSGVGNADATTPAREQTSPVLACVVGVVEDPS